MNFLGLRTFVDENNLTLDKLNKKIRHAAKNRDFQISIKQSHSESKVVSLIQKSRKKIDHLIITPELWTINGFILKEIIELTCIPYSIILKNNDPGIFKDSNIFISDNYITAYVNCINSLKPTKLG